MSNGFCRFERISVNDVFVVSCDNVMCIEVFTFPQLTRKLKSVAHLPTPLND